MASSSDEGEIVEKSPRPQSKLTSPLQCEESGVDRRDRLRDNARADAGDRHATPIGSRHLTSPDRRRDHAGDHSRTHNAHGRLQPPSRGYKRQRDDRYDDRRRPYARYDDDSHRHRGSYVDLDRPDDRNLPQRAATGRKGRGTDYRGDDRHRGRTRDGYSNKRPRNQTLSPPFRRDGDRSSLNLVENSKPIPYEDRDSSSRRNSTEGPKRASGAAATHDLPHQSEDAKRDQGHTGDIVMTGNAVSGSRLEPEQDEEADLLDEDAEIERRRRRREALLAKSSSATPLLLQALHVSDKPLGSPAQISQVTDIGTSVSGESLGAALYVHTNRPDAGSPALMNDPDTPESFDFERHDLGNKPVQITVEEGPSAADYDPTADMKEDGRRDELRHGNVHLHGQSIVLEGLDETPNEEVVDPPVNKKIEEDDDFDMFAEDFDEDKYAAAKPTRPKTTADVAEISRQPDGGILEGDDKDGYYKIRAGEVLNGRYQMQILLGRGMFSGVARALDLTTKRLVAIKIMRNNDALRKGGYTEIAILQKLNEADSEGRKHIVRFEHYFDFKGHLCLVFENLSMNLREVLRKFGNNVGINLNATRAYAHQIFVGLAHMRRCSIIHADLKPDNILINESRNVLKICDLGTAIDRSDAATAQDAVTPYLVSRFYRAPELILGMPYDYGVDMWSIGCTLYELYTGKILFAGDSNNQMLKAIMEVRGKLPPKLYKKGQLSAMHFDDTGRFLSVEKDRLGKTTIKTLPMVKPARDLRTRLTAASSGLDEGELRDLGLFIDLLEHCLGLNPDKRIKPLDALKHPFFTCKADAGHR